MAQVDALVNNLEENVHSPPVVCCVVHRFLIAISGARPFRAYTGNSREEKLYYYARATPEGRA